MNISYFGLELSDKEYQTMVKNFTIEDKIDCLNTVYFDSGEEYGTIIDHINNIEKYYEDGLKMLDDLKIESKAFKLSYDSCEGYLISSSLKLLSDEDIEDEFLNLREIMFGDAAIYKKFSSMALSDEDAKFLASFDEDYSNLQIDDRIEDY